MTTVILIIGILWIIAFLSAMYHQDRFNDAIIERLDTLARAWEGKPSKEQLALLRNARESINDAIHVVDPVPDWLRHGADEMTAKEVEEHYKLHPDDEF